MSKKERLRQLELAKKQASESQQTIQPIQIDNSERQNPKVFAFANFDECWAACVKNGSQSIKLAAEAHLKATKRWEDPSKWIEGLIHFGIPIEK